MFTVKGLLMVFLIGLLASCAIRDTLEYTPLVKVEKLDLKVALIISDEVKNAVHETTMQGRCVERGNTLLFCTECYEKKDGTIYTSHAVGLRTENLFIHGLPHLFNKVDIYKDITEIKNKGDYDYILVPESIVVTSYDKETARTRKISLTYEPLAKVLEPFSN